MNQTLTAEFSPPTNEEAEISVLGAMLLDNDVVNLVVQILDGESFYKKAHKELFQTIVDLYDKGGAVDLVILKDELSKRSLLEKVGGIEYLMTIEESVPMAANVEYYARIVREKAVKRHLINTAIKIQKDAYDDSSASDELLDRAERSIFEVTQKKYLERTTRLYDVLKETFDRIDDLHDRQNRLTGLPTGFYDLDDATCGLQPSELIIVAARPSMGKTSLALNILEHIGVVVKRPAALFSLEMSAHQIAQNMLCSHARIDAYKMRRGKLANNEWGNLTLAMGALSNAPIFIDDTPGLSLLELRAKARRLKAKDDIQIVIVDYLQLIEASTRGENRQQEISTISRGLKSLARELGIPIIAVSQLNRSVETREGHRPRMSDLRESGSIEQDADVIILLHREDYYSPEKTTGIADIHIAKQRNGPTCSIKLTFLSHFMRFENAASQTLGEEPYY